MTRTVCPVSFDSVTHGHLDVIGRTATLVERSWWPVGGNVSKTGLFTIEERVAM